MVATGLAEARLRLSGTYHAPFSILGQLADRTLLHGIAEGSLAALLDRLAASVLAEVERRAMERLPRSLNPGRHTSRRISRAAAPADPRRPRWLRPCAAGQTSSRRAGFTSGLGTAGARNGAHYGRDVRSTRPCSVIWRISIDMTFPGLILNSTRRTPHPRHSRGSTNRGHG
jgi:hypothetical protein